MNQKIISEQLDIQTSKILFDFDPKKYDFINNNYNKSYLSKIYIKFEIPAIYSSNERQFKWIKYLGYNIIDKIHCKINFINSTNINEINLYTYNEWLYIWYELNLNESEKQLHYELIGHTPELYDPALYNNNIYPTSHLKKQTYKWIINDNNINTATPININEDYNFNKPPSINSKILYIPLNFSFCNDISNIIPLNKISKINFTIILKEYTQLYTILLTPEDFVLNSNNNINLTTENMNNDFVLPNNIIFTSNKKPIFSSNMSLFDTIINDYRIIPIKNTTSSINNFILNNNISTTSNILYSNIEYTKQQFYNLCVPKILFTIIIDNIYTKKYIKINGLLNDINITQLNPLIIPNISTDKLTGYITDYNIDLKLTNSVNNISDVFLILKHSKRFLKNDFLNFTNYDFNNFNLWNTTTNKFNNINLMNNSIWDNLYTYNNIQIDINDFGKFSIKKKIQDTNQIMKYVNILEYQTNVQKNNNNNTILNVNSYKYYNENIIDNFNIDIDTEYTKKINYTNDKENYNFYNKVTLYTKYKSTVPGLYYLNFSNKFIKNINRIIINNAIINTLNIDNSNLYTINLYIIDNKKILFE